MIYPIPLIHNLEAKSCVSSTMCVLRTIVVYMLHLGLYLMDQEHRTHLLWNELAIRETNPYFERNEPLKSRPSDILLELPDSLYAKVVDAGLESERDQAGCDWRDKRVFIPDFHLLLSSGSL